MKLYLYDSNFTYIGEATAYAGVEYPNSTEIPINWEGRDKNIFRAKFDKANNEWTFHYTEDYLQSKAKELNLEIVTIDSMKEEDLKNGKLPELEKNIKKELKEESRKIVSKSIKGAKK